MGLDEMGLLERVEADADSDVEIDLRLTFTLLHDARLFKSKPSLVKAIDSVRTVTVRVRHRLDSQPR